MNVSSGGSGKPGSASQDFDLNLAPIIDCFTVLVTFLLASSAFLSIGIMDAGVSASSPSQSQTAPPPIQIKIEIKSGMKLALSTTGKATRSNTFTAKEGKYDFEAIKKELTGLKGSFPTVDAVTLSADDGIEYRDVIDAMEVIRKTQPVVMLGGFQ
ncbi:MAG: biopolymer transporter ExbD [Xanthomonadaceae bacterium]|nr:biopolymer transporter ExbD [Xanthomonadaceae bacterium]